MTALFVFYMFYFIFAVLNLDLRDMPVGSGNSSIVTCRRPHITLTKWFFYAFPLPEAAIQKGELDLKNIRLSIYAPIYCSILFLSLSEEEKCIVEPESITSGNRTGIYFLPITYTNPSRSRSSNFT